MPGIKPEVRTWVYRVGLAVIVLLGGYGLIDDNQALLWTGLLAAILSSGVASVYAPTKTAQEVTTDAAVKKFIDDLNIEITEELIDNLDAIAVDADISVSGSDVDVEVNDDIDIDGSIDIDDIDFVFDTCDDYAPHGTNPELIDEGDVR